jgi:hypothetical protein
LRERYNRTPPFASATLLNAALKPTASAVRYVCRR